ncbi:carbohydrate ABC transporter permease [Paenibacillus mendelii]|uniref:Carbohydrate ABC transporter permease n=1 Tax=Paenibacillus mendelii TaxID=206163 RepID=A0ABV6JEH0_9BACL
MARPELSTALPVAPPQRASLGMRFVQELRRSALSYAFIAPFFIVFLLFIAIPTLAAAILSFTTFNAVEQPRFIGWTNYINLLTQDLVFWKHAIPNTFKFAIIVGPVGYFMSFALAWFICKLPQRLRTYYTLAMYAPSLTAGVAMAVVWLIVFSGDRLGYLNGLLIRLNLIDSPQLWTQDPRYLLTIMMIVSIWSSMGIGFLAMIAGIQNVDTQLYEAGKIDGIKSALQEIWYITIPAMKPQMLFGAIMAVVGTLKAGAISMELSGVNPTPGYSGHLIINHIDDFGFIRFEMGYAATLSVFLLVLVYATSKICMKLFGSRGE